MRFAVRLGENERVAVAFDLRGDPRGRDVELDAELDSVIAQIKESYPQMTVSNKASNRMLGENGVYVTYRIKMPMGEGEQELMTRGRILIVPVNKKLYQVRYICPAEYNSDYENVFKKIRSTMTEL